MLATLINSGTAIDIIFNLPGGPSDAFLEDDGTAGNGLSRLRSNNGSFETTTFANPTGSLTINSGHATDTLTLNTLPDFNASLTIAAAANLFSTVTFAGAVTLAANRSLSAQAFSTISLNSSSADIATSGSGSVSLTTLRDITMGLGASVNTVDGGITVSANAAGTHTDSFVGISLDNAKITTSGTGNISLTGTGSGSDVSSRHGIRLQNGAQIETTGTGLMIGEGKITLTGTGGAGISANWGVYIVGTNSKLTSTGSGDIQVTGNGGNASGSDNYGVFLTSGAQAESTGNGKITVLGTGGAGSSQNIGVAMRGGKLTSMGSGDIQVTGKGGNGSGFLNHGVYLLSGSQVESTGSGKITVLGTGGGTGSSDFNYGVRILQSGSRVSSTKDNAATTGDIHITGAAGLGSSSRGLENRPRVPSLPSTRCRAMAPRTSCSSLTA